MYNAQVIQDELMGLVGIRQTNDPNFTKLSPVLTKTAANVLVQHPLINIENLDMTSRNYSEWVYPVWVGATPYNVGDRVMEGAVIYDSLVAANTGNQPSTSPAQWQEVSLLSLYLEDVFRNAIDDVVNNLVTMKKLRSEVKTLLRSLALYEGVGSMNDLIVNQGDLVGFAIQPKRSRNLAIILNMIGTQFTLAGTLDLWLYHSSQYQSIAQFSVVRNSPYSFEWSELEEQLQNLPEYDAAGTFYLVYDQAALTVGQALRRRISWGVAPCGGCSSYNLNAYNKYTKFMTVRAIRITAANRNLNPGNPDFLWDIDQIKFENDTNYGLNFQMTVRCDLTDFFIENKDVFTFAIRDMVVYKLIESIANSTRQNNIDEKTKGLAMVAMQDPSVGGGGVKHAAEKQMKAIDFEFSGFDDVCMPCNNKNGLVWGSTSLNR